jgi:hypothetical protein
LLEALTEYVPKERLLEQVMKRIVPKNLSEADAKVGRSKDYTPIVQEQYATNAIAMQKATPTKYLKIVTRFAEKPGDPLDEHEFWVTDDVVWFSEAISSILDAYKVMDEFEGASSPSSSSSSSSRVRDDGEDEEEVKTVVFEGIPSFAMFHVVEFLLAKVRNRNLITAWACDFWFPSDPVAVSWLALATSRLELFRKAHVKAGQRY